MFKKIMVPVDLAHKEDLGKALNCARDLARHYGAEIVYVGVTTTTPSQTAHNPKEYQSKLDAFAQEQARDGDITASAKMLLSHDPRSDVDDVLLKAVGDTGADLVVMASHMPNILDYVWPSNGGKIAEHAKCSVMVVRGQV
ncbi:universal stress protein [Roseovarius sp. SCSIO 43702]|uniref:universal stress protein n=1 Tax=Roseovarius sp. SCSIO 43702 TaxID=2823043 RepID=UPI001C739D74|nr:universal stress protein [Roseovarius sp. SCSIO 43702]QYX57949.1 universal stress protein [Roseovarius sp. SCSIO 43702]